MRKRIHPVNPGRYSFEFTCPHCGGHDLSEIFTVTRSVEAAYEHTSLVDYTYEIEIQHKYIELGKLVLTRKYGGNRYVCDDCGEPLTDQYGNAAWGGNFLYDWLSKHIPETEFAD